jgi:D-3-phosphoglycerate dehydrogenase
VDNIDLNATRQRKIFVTNVPDANKHAVADFAFGLILNTARQIYQAISETKAGNWPRIFATDVCGKTLGIVGLGHIGKSGATCARIQYASARHRRLARQRICTTTPD